MAASALLFLPVLVRGYDGWTWLRGDCGYYYYAAVSILQDFDVDLGNQLSGGLQANAGQISLASDGRLVPKHPLPLSLAALPLIAAFGERGALAFNCLQVLLLLALSYRLAASVAAPAWACAAVVATAAGSFLRHYVWNFSPDVFASCLLLGAFLLLATPRERPLPACGWGGALAGLACIAKFPYLVFMPGLGLLAARSWRALGAFAAGAGLSFALLATYDAWLFGSPFVTSYDRIAELRDGRPATRSQRADFDLSFASGARGQLLDPRHGLATTSPITLASFLGVVSLLRRRPRLGVAIAAGAVALFTLFSGYSLWYTSHYGNRFLMPVLALAAVPLACLLDALWLRRHAGSVILSPES